jgi:hypothetical protein
MNSQTLISRARLEHAEALLREALARDFDGNTSSLARSLARMLVHVVNIHRAVSSAPEAYGNAAKRLGDFAATLERMALARPEAAPRLERAAAAMRAARTEMHKLAGAADLPPATEIPPGRSSEMAVGAAAQMPLAAATEMPLGVRAEMPLGAAPDGAAAPTPSPRA